LGVALFLICLVLGVLLLAVLVTLVFGLGAAFFGLFAVLVGAGTGAGATGAGATTGVVAGTGLASVFAGVAAFLGVAALVVFFTTGFFGDPWDKLGRYLCLSSSLSHVVLLY